MDLLCMSESMAERDRNQVTLTLNDKAFEEFLAVAEWQNLPLATMLRQELEHYHRSPSFKSLIDRVRREKEEKKQGGKK